MDPCSDFCFLERGGCFTSSYGSIGLFLPQETLAGSYWLGQLSTSFQAFLCRKGCWEEGNSTIPGDSGESGLSILFEGLSNYLCPLHQIRWKQLLWVPTVRELHLVDPRRWHPPYETFSSPKVRSTPFLFIFQKSPQDLTMSLGLGVPRNWGDFVVAPLPM